MRATFPVAVDVQFGTIAVQVPDSEDFDIAVVDRRTVSALASVAPRGEEGCGLERADVALAELGWTVVESWVEHQVEDMVRACRVAPGAA